MAFLVFCSVNCKGLSTELRFSSSSFPGGGKGSTGRCLGIVTWPWQLVATYINGMEEISRLSKSPTLRRLALGTLSLSASPGTKDPPQNRMGLLDMLSSSSWPSGNANRTHFAVTRALNLFIFPACLGLIQSYNWEFSLPAFQKAKEVERSIS